MYTPSGRLCRGALCAALALAVGCGSPDQVLLGRGTPAADGGRVVAFVLVDVATRADLRQLVDGDTIDTTASSVTIRAVVEPLDPGSVVFAIDGRTVRTEENPPWMIAGNDPNTGKLYVWTIAAGTHLVRATPYSAAAGGGVPGVALEQTFIIQ